MILAGQQLPFDIAIAFPMFLSWIVVISASFILILKGKTSTKISIILCLISLILGGFILGATPNAVIPIQQILANLRVGASITTIVPMIVILALLLLSTLLLGRIFCGHACPIGALEELISIINFKSSIKAQKNNKLHLDIPNKITNIIRWIFVGFIVILSLIWTISILQILNPFLGFSFIKNPYALALFLPLIMLIVVAVTSFFIYRPWCRLMCPFGTIASITSRFSLYKYARTEDCNECGLCEKICPTQEASKESKKGECYFCNRCINVCPENAIKLEKKNKKL
jgi:polyferredoxin